MKKLFVLMMVLLGVLFWLPKEPQIDNSAATYAALLSHKKEVAAAQEAAATSKTVSIRIVNPDGTLKEVYTRKI